MRAVVRGYRPDVIVNAAAYTAVDKAESEEALANTINAVAVGVLAQEAARSGALLLHYSTDYVFDGTKPSPYTESDVPNPVNAYGRSKLAGERAMQEAKCDHIVLRTTWVYASRGKNFVKTILRLACERPQLSIVADQFGAPTCARSIADVTAHILFQTQRERAAGVFASGIYQATCAGHTSWHGFADAIVQDAVELGLIESDRAPRVDPIPTSSYPLPAKRPANSRLDNEQLKNHYKISLPHWRQALNCVIREIADAHLTTANKGS
jgi:dTDP-4-dehydrorhamnose reductase